MNTLLTYRTSTLALLGVATALRTAASLVAGLAHRLEAWLARRERAQRDYAALAEMSDRDLADIGLSRGYRAHVARGAWAPDAFR